MIEVRGSEEVVVVHPDSAFDEDPGGASLLFHPACYEEWCRQNQPCAAESGNWWTHLVHESQAICFAIGPMFLAVPFCSLAYIAVLANLATSDSQVPLENVEAASTANQVGYVFLYSLINTLVNNGPFYIVVAHGLSSARDKKDVAKWVALISISTIFLNLLYYALFWKLSWGLGLWALLNYFVVFPCSVWKGARFLMRHHTDASIRKRLLISTLVLEFFSIAVPFVWATMVMESFAKYRQQVRLFIRLFVWTPFGLALRSFAGVLVQSFDTPAAHSGFMVSLRALPELAVGVVDRLMLAEVGSLGYVAACSYAVAAIDVTSALACQRKLTWKNKLRAYFNRPAGLDRATLLRVEVEKQVARSVVQWAWMFADVCFVLIRASTLELNITNTVLSLFGIQASAELIGDVLSLAVLQDKHGAPVSAVFRTARSHARVFMLWMVLACVSLSVACMWYFEKKPLETG